MAEYVETTFEEASAHLNDVLGIDLTHQLVSGRWHHLKAWSIITPLIALYRYAELLDEKIKIYDMVAKGHKSHLSGTDLDFGYASADHRKKAIHQVRIINDLLELKDALRSQSGKITSFRLGFYFDKFDNDENLKKLQKADDKIETFNELYKNKTGLSSLHLGLRYDYTADIYHGGDMKKGAGVFGFWGKSGEGYGRGMKWASVIKEMDGNVSKGRMAMLATTILDDFRKLDLRIPGVAYGRDPLPPWPQEPEPTSVWA